MENETIKCPECGKELLTLDSLRKHRSIVHKIPSEQTYIEYKLNGIKPTCACGCGEDVKFLGFELGYREYKLGHASRVNNNWGHNKEANKKSHETQKKMHESGELVIWNKGLTIEDDRVRDYIIKVMANPERGKNISKKLIGVPKSDEHKIKIKENAIIRWSNPDECEKQSHRRMQFIIKNGFCTKSKLEDVFADILFDVFSFVEHEHYHRQFYVREIKGLYDFKIRGKKILIEVDGDFWHCNPNSTFAIPKYESQKGNLIQDKIKEEWCKNNDYKLLRFWESDINNHPQEVIKRLKEELK